MQDLLITNNTALIISSVNIHSSNNIQIKNTSLINNTGGEAVRTSYGLYNINYYDTAYFTNCVFMNNNPDYSIPDEGFGGALSVTGLFFLPNTMNTILYNCLFVANHSKSSGSAPGATSLSAFNGGKAFVINSTFANNTSENIYGANIGSTTNSDIIVYNSIFNNNEPAEFYMATGNQTGDCSLSIYNSLVDGGEENIRILTGGTILYYDTTNIDTDPLFYGGDEFPYNLSAESPCIDAGTLDLPDFIHLPDKDLAGNPRVVNGKIDMGAYEWNPTVDVKHHELFKQSKNLVVAPNPFNSTTFITAHWNKTAKITIDVYNNNGLLVNTLQQSTTPPGSCSIPWDGTAGNGSFLPGGVYIVTLSINGKEAESVKVVKR